MRDRPPFAPLLCAPPDGATQRGKRTAGSKCRVSDGNRNAPRRLTSGRDEAREEVQLVLQVARKETLTVALGRHVQEGSGRELRARLPQAETTPRWRLGFLSDPRPVPEAGAKQAEASPR